MAWLGWHGWDDTAEIDNVLACTIGALSNEVACGRFRPLAGAFRSSIASASFTIFEIAIPTRAGAEPNLWTFV
jgi:hypothetical protein